MVISTQKHYYVLKRDGREEQVQVDKITSRIKKLCYGLNMEFIDPVSITLKVIRTLRPGISTTELDSFAAETAAAMATDHPDYAILAARIEVSNLHKETKKQFSEVIDYVHKVENNGKSRQMISDKHHEIIMKHADRLNSVIIYDRDFTYNYFDFRTLERSCLWKINGKIVERPQHMLMRTAVGIHGDDIDAAVETYNLLSERYFIHPNQTFYAAATPTPQLASTYLMTMPDDSIRGIFDCCAQYGFLAEHSAGVGLSIHKIRAKGTYIAGTGGISNGIVPLLKVYDSTAKWFSEARQNRPGFFTIYLEPWHADIFEYVDLKKNVGVEEVRARNLSYGLWIPDLFMKRVKENGVWSLMCPHQCPGLPESWGEEFEALYTKYEAQGKYIRQVQAQDLWRAIVTSQVETGSPSMLYKDACNRKSNQQHLGTIRNSSLYGEAVEYTSPEEVAVCISAYIAVNKFVDVDQKSFDFKRLKDVTKVVTKNLNKIININYYPLSEAESSNSKHRPLGIGIQGLTNTFNLLKMPFESEEALLLNKQIFETIYYGALDASAELAKTDGTYATYKGSATSRGILQFDMWDVTPTDLWDWAPLREKIKQHGLRNSLLVAPVSVPVSTQILGNNNSMEPCTSNVYTLKVLGDEVAVVNKHLINDLIEQGLWNEEMKHQILSTCGSIQSIPDIPNDIKEIYKTVWEVKQKSILEMAAARAPFIDQSQSLNIYMENPTVGIITSMHFYGWQLGLKTGMCVFQSRT